MVAFGVIAVAISVVFRCILAIFATELAFFFADASTGRMLTLTMIFGHLLISLEVDL